MTASPPQRDLGPIDLTSMEKAPHHHSEADNKPRKPRWSVDSILNKQEAKQPPSPSSVEAPSKADEMDKFYTRRANEINVVLLRNEPIVSLLIDGKERLCLAQISNTLLKNFSYNEIHNRRVALGINCVQCTPVQLEILRRLIGCIYLHRCYDYLFIIIVFIVCLLNLEYLRQDYYFQLK